jgi:hypothetical protein
MNSPVKNNKLIESHMMISEVNYSKIMQIIWIKWLINLLIIISRLNYKNLRLIFIKIYGIQQRYVCLKMIIKKKCSAFLGKCLKSFQQEIGQFEIING